MTLGDQFTGWLGQLHADQEAPADGFRLSRALSSSNGSAARAPNSSS